MIRCNHAWLGHKVLNLSSVLEVYNVLHGLSEVSEAFIGQFQPMLSDDLGYLHV